MIKISKILIIGANVLLLAPGLRGQDPEWLGSYDSLAIAQHVMINGNYAYITDFTLGLVIIDISDPSQPSHAGEYNTPYWEFDSDIQNGLAYIGSGISEPYLGGFYVVDVRDPSNPEPRGNLSFDWEVTEVEAVGYYAYIATFGGSYVIDITDPDSIQNVSPIVTPGYILDMCYDDLLYIADGSAGLTIMGLADPEHPTFIGNCDTPGNACAVSTGDLYHGFAYVADTDSGMQIINVGDPTNPFLVSRLNLPARIYDIDVSGSYAYMAVGDSGLVIARIDNPGAPYIVGRAVTPAPAYGVDRSMSQVYVACGQSLEIYSFNPPHCHYVPGDINNNGHFNGMDVTYMVYYFKGSNPPPSYSCECSMHGTIYPAGDINGNCLFNGVDVTYAVRFLWDGPGPIPCPDCPPE